MLLQKRGVQSRFLIIVSIMALILVGAVCAGVGLISNQYQAQQARQFIEELQTQRQTQEALLSKGLEQKGEALAAILAENGSSLMVGYDFDTLASMAENGAGDKDVAFVVFYDAEGKALTKEPPAVAKNVRAIDKDIEFEGEKIGSVRLGLDFSAVKKAVEDVQKRLQQATQEAEAGRKEALHAIIVRGGGTALFGLVLLCLVMSWSLRSLITKPLKGISDGLGREAERVSAASDQVASASESLAEGAGQQAASVEETSSSLEEMGSMTKQNAENAQQAARIVQASVGRFEAAGQAMARLTTSMEEISTASEETQKIIKTIDEIAFQTNLLSLNAAVEAARAGEAGAGFAVVADEVRNLAMRAADAAKNTADIIEGTVKRIHDGSLLVGETNRSFEEVLRDSEKVSGLVAEIAAASSEQSQGIDQIATAVTQIDQVVQQNAANAEQSAAASRELKTRENRMRDFVDDLIRLVNGTARSGEAESTGEGNHSEPSAQRLRAASGKGNGSAAWVDQEQDRWLESGGTEDRILVPERTFGAD